MSMSFMVGAAAALALGALTLGGLATAPSDGSFEEIRPWEAPQQSRKAAPPRHLFMPARRVTSDSDAGFAAAERYGERFRYAD